MPTERKELMMPQRRTNPRVEHRLRQIERANLSANMSEKFPKLKSLVVNLDYFDAGGTTRNGQIKYKVDPRHAKSVFCFTCPSGECVGGDFDLSDVLAKAVAGKKKIAEGEMRCEGWRRKGKQDKVPCANILRYKLTLGY